ncbi:hypothetical protein BKA66DRAFT_404832 [Pyrenochaeta sp. MPI-SDFR-AT-0127]|nr:hypothetical protein BKA66DRAFT_404832 [Pyrenochaeta sp. MPI-SDFR-AT-0127]
MALPVATPRALPPLLRYVDHNLMQNVSAHNRPPHPNATCPVCFLQWDSSPMVTVAAASSLRTTPKATSVIISTFLPLSPCRHWVHYSCLIWLATQTTSDHKDRCPVCHIQLFEWEGITALTLATRTDLELQDQQKDGFFHPISHVYTPSDRTAYETECTLIDSLIAHFFFAQLNQPSRFVDLSPDLLRPAAKWLSWTTQTGFLLLGMLIAIKMRRFLLEGHKGIVSTESWKEFDEGVKALQKRIMDEVHQP